MPVITTTATVYFGGRRRWFSLNAACRAEAKAKLKTHCECSKGDWNGRDGTPGETCFYHEPENYDRMVRRLARIYKANYLTQV